MSSIRALFVAALSVLLLCATSSLAQNSTDEVWFGAAVLRGSYLYPQALGIILFGQSSRSGEVNVFVQIDGLPNGQYALHVHNWGDLTSSLGSQNISTADTGVGTHFNPFGAPHGCDSPGTFQTKHVGDIGNYTAMQGATPFNQFTSSLLDLSYTNRSIIGRAVVLHVAPDHCVQPTGNAGTPILQGVIGVANPWLNAWFSKLSLVGLPTLSNATKNSAALPLAASAATDPHVAYGIGTSQSAVAVLFPLGKSEYVQQPQGVVRFGPVAANSAGAYISITIRYLQPNSTHGIHIHQYGDDFDGSFSPYTPTPGHYFGADNFANSGGHFNPYGEPHGFPNSSMRHEGDLGNITADAHGSVDLVIQSSLIDFLNQNTSIVGRAVIVHALPDSGAQPTGAAGNRILAGVIGLSNQAYTVNQKSDFTPFNTTSSGDAADDGEGETYAVVAAVVVAILVAVLVAAMYVRYSYAKYDKFMECCDCGGCLRFYCGGKSARESEAGSSGYGTLQD